MIEIMTSRFGTLKVEEERLLVSKRGLIGFPNRRRFFIIRPSTDSVLYWFQCADDPDLAFVITPPFLFVPDYRLHFGHGVLEEMAAEKPEDLQIYVLVTIPAGRPEDMTANLIGPLVINPKSRRVEQLVVEEATYSHKHPLLKHS